MTQGDLQPCNDPGPIKDLTEDVPPPFCREDQADCDNPLEASLKDVPGRANSWLDEFTLKKTGVGQAANCDPITKGYIVNQQDGKPADRSTLYRYSKSIRGTNEAMKDLFSDIVVQDESSKYFSVPIIWGTQEKAVIAILGENYRQDNTLAVDSIRLPMMTIHASDYSIDMNRYTYHKAIDYLRDYQENWRPGFAIKERYERDTVFGVSRGIPVNIGYTLYVWTGYEEDMVQIAEQIMQKTAPMGYIRVRGVGWEIPVKLESIANNVDYEPGDRATRLIKYQFNFTAESYVAQPIVRKKAVLKTKVDVVDNVDDDKIKEVITRLEQAVEELQ